jgi:hypothetical protein
VDGSNVAFEEMSEAGKPKVSNIVALRAELESRGYEPIIIVDAALVHKVDDADQLDALIESQQIRQAPAGTDADFFIIETARELDAVVVSNDTYKEYSAANGWLKQRRIPLMIVKGDVQLYDPQDGGQ